MVQSVHVTVQMATAEVPVEVSAPHGVQQMTHYLYVKWSCGLLQYLMQLCTRIIFSMANLQHLLCDKCSFTIIVDFCVNVNQCNELLSSNITK